MAEYPGYSDNQKAEQGQTIISSGPGLNTIHTLQPNSHTHEPINCGDFQNKYTYWNIYSTDYLYVTYIYQFIFKQYE